MSEINKSINGLDEVAVGETVDTPTESKPENLRILSSSEVARTELFSIQQTIDIESINENMNKEYALAKKKNLQEEQAKKLEKDNSISDTKLEANSVDNFNETTAAFEEVKDVNSKKEVEVTPIFVPEKKIQEKIDFTNITTTLYNSSETDNSRNYKKLFDKLIKKTEDATSPFKLETQSEGKLEKLAETGSKELKQPIDENDSAQIIDGSLDKNETDKISKRIYSPRTAIDDVNNFTYINKLIFATLSSVCILCLIETGIMYFVINALNPIHAVFYYIAGLIALIPFGVGLFKYSFDPSRAVKKKFSYALYFLNAIIVVVLLLVLLIIIVLLFSISLVNPTDYVPKILLPCLYILNYPIGIVFFIIYEKAKLFNVK